MFEAVGASGCLAA